MTNDDKKRYNFNNGLLLVNFVDKKDSEKKFGLYRYDASAEIPKDLQKLTLKRKAADELAKATQFEHVRNYGFS